MAGKNYIFGVRARLALIIILLLAGVSGTQYVINYRQQQEVMRKLVEINREINRTIRDIDRQLKNRSRSAPVVLPGEHTSRIKQELNSFLEYVDSNFERILTQQAGFQDILDRIIRLRNLASSSQSPGSGLSFFDATVSVMDEISRKNHHWHYSISNSPFIPPAKNMLQVSIPIVEEGQVHFVHLQYEISDFLENFKRSNRTSLLVTLAVLGLGLVFAFVYSGHFTRPIRRLSEGFSRIEQGDLNFRIKSDRKDELGQLVDGFNHMVQRLKQNKELEKTLYRQQRLSSLGKLAAGIAHEIKNPLNAISLSLQHLGDKLNLEEPRDRELFERYNGNIQREVSRLSKIVDTFLNYSRVSAGP